MFRGMRKFVCDDCGLSLPPLSDEQTHNATAQADTTICLNVDMCFTLHVFN